MPWDVDLIRHTLEGMVNRALQHSGEPPFPFLEQIRLWQDDRHRDWVIELRFSNGTAVNGRFHERCEYEHFDRYRNTRLSFQTLELLARDLYIERATALTRTLTQRRLEESAPRGMPFAVIEEDAAHATSRWREQAMSHSFNAPRRPPQNPYAAQILAAQQQMIRNGFGYEFHPNYLRTPIPTPPAAPPSGAHRKGRELLWNNITDAQKVSLKERGYFEVIGNRSGHTYRIYHGTQQNVVKMPGPMPGPPPQRRLSWANPFRLEETRLPNLTPREREIYSLTYPHGLCFMYSGLVPGDAMLGQKLSIETEEDAMVKVAIGFGVNRDLDMLNDYAARASATYWADMVCAPPATAMEA